MKHSCLMPLVAAGAALLASATAHGQPLFSHAESIEAAVANADLVFVGKLEVGGKKEVDPNAIAVEQTLKGEHRDQRRIRPPHSGMLLTEWKKGSRRFLVTAQAAVHDEFPTATNVIDLESKELAVLTAEFTLLQKPNDVIRAAKEAVRRMPGVKRIDTFGLAAPLETVAGTRWESYYHTGGHLVLSVPIDEQLEKTALKYSRSANYRQRQEGALALRYFRSDENVARAKALLSDPEWSSLHRAEDNEGLEVRRYGVRQHAYETLAFWGIAAEKPTIREELLKLESVRTVSRSNRRVSDADIKALARFENLAHLFLWNTEVGDDSLREIAALDKLENLYLGGTKVTDAGLAHLAKLAKLEYLDLRGTKLTDEGLKTLAAFKALKKIDVAQTGVTEAGIAELRELRPNLEIQQ